MAKHGRLKVDFPDGRESVWLTFAVSDNDEALLRKYSAATREAISTAQQVGGLAVNLTLTVTVGEPVQFTATEPNSVQRAAILHRLRPLILTNEPASFNNVCAAVKRSSTDDFMKRHLRLIRDRYRGAVMRQQVAILRDEVALNSDTAFENWLNGFGEYHSYPDAAAKIHSENDLLPIEAKRPIFMLLLREKLDAIILLNQIVEKMLEEPEVERPVA
jgi:hypothetical protein